MVLLLRKKDSVNFDRPFAGVDVVVSRIVVSTTRGMYVATGKQDEGTVERGPLWEKRVQTHPSVQLTERV